VPAIGAIVALIDRDIVLPKVMSGTDLLIRSVYQRAPIPGRIANS